MSSGHNYPSPTHQQQQQQNYGPFYNQHSASHSPSSHDVPDDAQLRAELSRSLALAPILSSAPPDANMDDSQSPTRQSTQASPHPEAVLGAGVDGLGPGGVGPDHDGEHGPEHDHEHDVEMSQGPSDSIGHHELSTTSAVDDGAAAVALGHKRSKVSRACDECRRKKIRCDAQDESAQNACSNCRRTGAVCAFSRQPMKRGPSKGYIKELADRLNALEGQMHPQHLQQADSELQLIHQTLAEAGVTPRREPELLPYPPSHAPPQHQQPQQILLPQPPQSQPQPQPQPPPPPEQQSRKRTHAQAEGYHDAPLSVSRPPPPLLPSPQPPSLYSVNHAESPRPSPYPSENSSTVRQPPEYHPYRQPQGIPLQPFFKHGGDFSHRTSISTPYEPEANVTAFIDWDEEVIDEYYRIIHQTFPLLPHSKNRLRMRLAECPSSLREAFLTVLECTMRTFPSSSLHATHSYAPMIKRAAELLAGYPFENPATHNSGTNLVYLQTLLLMALESDNHGPATVRGQAGPSRAEWLGRAAGVAGQLEINLIRPRARFVEGDPDSDERLSRRVWWVLFILDRWHASSTADLLKLPENSVVLLPEDQILLGESTYHLARLSFIIGHLAAILTTTKTPETNVMAPSNPASSLLGLALSGEIDRFRESVESVWGSLNLVHLSYHHCHLLIKRLNPVTEPTELISHALKVATVLNQRQTPITPLNHHFAALSAMTLCELVDVQRTHVDAVKGIEQISQALGLGRGLAGHETSSGWDSAIRALVVRKKEKLAAQAAASAAASAASASDSANGGDGGGGLRLGSAAAAAAHIDGDTATPTSLDGNVAATSVVGEGGRRGKFDPTMLTRYGYLTALGQGMFVAK